VTAEDDEKTIPPKVFLISQKIIEDQKKLISNLEP
jgi:hypothetical protein